MGFIDKLFGSKKVRSEESKDVKAHVKAEENKEVKAYVKAEENKEVKVEEKKVVEIKKTDENELTLNILKKMLSEMNLEIGDNKEMAVIPEIDTSIKAKVRGKTQQAKDVIVQIDFLVSNGEFGEEGIYETLAGIGKENNVEEAIKNSIDTFTKTVFKVVLEALKDKHNLNLDIETSLKGLTRIWHPHVGTIQAHGFDDLTGAGNNRIYNLLKDEIVKRLRNKRFYWIKVFVSRQIDGKLMYQCLLNNKPFLEADRILEEYVKGWTANNTYMVEIQYIVIRQSDKSWNENKEKDIENESFMKKCAQYAIGVFESYGPDDNIEGLVNKIAEFTKDLNLAWEFFWFIPAIYCRLILSGPNYPDTVVMVLPDDRKIFGKLYDYESYVIGVDVVIQDLQTNKSQENIQKVLLLSDEFKALQKALSEGSKPEDLQAIPMVLMVPRNYVVND